MKVISICQSASSLNAKPASINSTLTDMNKTKALAKLSKAITEETIGKLMGKVWDDNWNTSAHVEITLTIDELRCAAFLHDGKAPNWWIKPIKSHKP